MDVADGVVTLTKTVVIRNSTTTNTRILVTPTFRFADDAANGAVTVSAPAKVVVKPGKRQGYTIQGYPDHRWRAAARKLHELRHQWRQPSVLTLNEYDGYLVLDEGHTTNPSGLACAAAQRCAVVPDTTDIVPGSFPQVIGLNNTGVGTAQNDAYALLAVSDNHRRWLGRTIPDTRYPRGGYQHLPCPAGLCSANPSFLWAFAINTWERNSISCP